MKNIYSKKVMEHFIHPKNVGKIKNASGKGKIGNSICGDIMEMTINVDEKGKNKVISDAKFQTFGCGAAVATSSIVTELVKGKTLDEAKKLTPQIVDKSLQNLPSLKKHCAKLAVDALKEAIRDYENR